MVRRVEVEVRTLAAEDAPKFAAPLADLLRELSSTGAPSDPEELATRLGDARVRVAVAVDGERLLGTATLALLVTLADGLVGRVEDVIVSPEARGTGLGRSLMEALHAEAERLGVAYIELTSRPAREVANLMYVSLGYERRETNVYRLRIA
jgi:ribosomal protein S18 acetylase RimI-like enzyme